MKGSELITLLSKGKSEAYLGPQGFKILASIKALELGQLGYSLDKNGANIAGNTPGSWQKNWYVIAKDTELGDPYYIDQNDEKLPVYTAIYNKENNQWQSTPVSCTLTAFIECIDLLHHFTKQKQPQYIPDSSSIFDLERLENFGMQLAHLSEETAFWQSFFVSYVDWLTDDTV
ncbi:hypothetical protein AADZ91_18025 [Colwelliaceae bacterium 6441]